MGWGGARWGGAGWDGVECGGGGDSLPLGTPYEAVEQGLNPGQGSL